MRMFQIAILTMMGAGATLVPAEGLLDSIRTPERSVPVVHQSPEGAWLLELRRPGAPADQPPALNLITMHPNGTATASAADQTQTGNVGTWVRVGDRKFVGTMLVFNFNEAKVLTTITKIRTNFQLSPDGQTMRGTQEIVVIDREGKVMATITGGTHTGVRLTPEIAGDFQAFLGAQ